MERYILSFVLLFIGCSAYSQGEFSGLIVNIEKQVPSNDWVDWQLLRGEEVLFHQENVQFETDLFVHLDSIPYGDYIFKVQLLDIEEQQKEEVVLYSIPISICCCEVTEVFLEYYSYSSSDDESLIQLGVYAGLTDGKPSYRFEYEIGDELKSENGWFFGGSILFGFETYRAHVDTATFDSKWNSNKYTLSNFYYGPSIMFGKSWRAGNQSIVVGAGATYRLPLYSSAKGRTGNYVFKEQRVHDYNDVRANAFIGLSTIRLKVCYRFFDFIEAPYQQVPQWQVGISMGLSGL